MKLSDNTPYLKKIEENSKYLLNSKLISDTEWEEYQMLKKQVKDYKSRCDKAVEYIQNHQLVFELSSKKVISQWFDMFYKDTLNILNGRSDE